MGWVEDGHCMHVGWYESGDLVGAGVEEWGQVESGVWVGMGLGSDRCSSRGLGWCWN